MSYVASLLFFPYFGRQWILSRIIWLIRSNISIYRELRCVTLIFSTLWSPMNPFEDNLVNEFEYINLQWVASLLFFPHFGRQWITLKTIWLIRWNISIYSELRHPLFPPYFGRQWIPLRMIWLIRSNISIYSELSCVTLIFSILWSPMKDYLFN